MGPIDFQKASEKLKSIQQEHLLHYWDTLSVPQRTHLLHQISHLDLNLFTLQQKAILYPSSSTELPIEPFLQYTLRGSEEDKQRGKKRIADGKVGCLLIAGGQGTRLRFTGPKGMFPISLIQHKTLFQLFAEKTLAAGKQAGRPLPLAIMTSPLNHTQTQQYFTEHHFFGLVPEQVSFYMQEILPLLDTEGRLFLDAPDQIAEGPNGNGGALREFYASGLWDQWNKKGVEDLLFVLIDNPLADPFDAELVGFHHREKADVTIKCIERERAEEKVGVLVKQEGKVKIKEYTEIPPEEQTARLPNGSFRHPCANLSLFCFSMRFIQEIAEKNSYTWPLHPAFKAVKYLDTNGLVKNAEKPMAWKFEYFIFDVIPLAKRVAALQYPRNECFAPLKNQEGENSLATVQAALQQVDRLTYEKISGTITPRRPFELSQAFYYPNPHLLNHWKGRPLPIGPYIEDEDEK